MFDTLFNYPKVLARHQAGPAADARRRYLVHRATVDGVAHATLLRIARELLIVARWIDLTHDRPVTPQGILSAAQRWAAHQLAQGRAEDERWSRRLFIQTATAWLRFLGRLVELPRIEPDGFSANVEDFVTHLRDERGLAPATVRARRWHVDCFLKTVRPSKASIAQITIADVDAFLSLKGQEGWCRVSVASSAGARRIVTLQTPPAIPYSAAITVERRISRDGMVSVDGNLYSVPDSTRRRTVEVQVYPKEIRIFEAGQRIACHPVLQGKHQSRLDPSHRQAPPRQQAVEIDPGPDRGVSKRPLAFYDAVAQRLASEAVR